MAATPLREWPGLVAALTVILAAIPLTAFAVHGHPMKKLIAAALCQGFVYAWLAGWLAVAARRRWVAAAIGGVVALAMWLMCLPVIFADRMMSPEVLLLMLETDAREAGSFLGMVMSARPVLIAAGLLLVFAAMIWAAIKYGGRLRCCVARRPWLRGAAWVVCLSAGAAGTAHLIYMYSRFMTGDIARFENWTIRQSRLVPTLFNSDEAVLGDGVTALLFTVRGLRINTSELPRWEDIQRQVLATEMPRAAEADSVNIVVIIGESFIKHHSPLYGYPLATTPRMSAEAEAGRLVAMTDYISPANITSASMRNMMNLNSAGDGERWADAAFFPLVAARAGWRVRLFDNQLTKTRYTVDVQLAAMMRNPLLTSRCYSLANDSICLYDGDFISLVDSIAPPGNTVGLLDIYHLYGQHFAPADRYPANAGFDRYNADSIPYSRPWLTPEKKQYIAEYDNATRYNDYVIGRIIDRYAHTPTVFLYFSDHGEEMYDASDCAVRNEPSGDLAGWLRRQFEIPFFVIANERYIALRPGRWHDVRNAADRPGMLDNIGQAVLGLAATGSRYYRPERDIFSPTYRCPPRRTVTRSLLYDSIVGHRPENNR